MWWMTLLWVAILTVLVYLVFSSKQISSGRFPYGLLALLLGECWLLIPEFTVHQRDLTLPRLLIMGAVALAVVWAVLWVVPQRQTKGVRFKTAQERFQSENAARATLAQIIAGSFFFITAYFSWQQNLNTREGQMIDRFTKVVDQLSAPDHGGEDAATKRMGAIAALGDIAKRSETQYQPAMQVLCSYVRHYAPHRRIFIQSYKSKSQPALPDRAVEVDQILETIGSMARVADPPFGELNLRETQLDGKSLAHKNFSGTDFSNSSLQGTYLLDANLRRCEFYGADLRGADLSFADLSGASLIGSEIGQRKIKIGTSEFAAGETNFRGAVYDRMTLWPFGFDPQKHGATRVGIP